MNPCPRCETYGCPSQFDRLGTAADHIFADIACSLRAIAKHGESQASLSRLELRRIEGLSR